MNLRWPAAVIAGALTVSGVLVVKWEGERLVAYKPFPTDPWTICNGHTRGVYEGMRATPEQCKVWREEDELIAMTAINRCIDYPLTANQLGALTSATLNNGPSIVCGSTLQRKANAGDMKGACRELTHARNSDGGNRGWAFVAGQYVRGLFFRRTDEESICWPNFGNVIGGNQAANPA